MTRLNLFLFLLAVSATVVAEGEQCRVVNYEQHKFIRIQSRLHHGTHIELPEILIARPVTGNRDLWDVEGENRHIFVKPNDAGTTEGRQHYRYRGLAKQPRLPFPGGALG